MKRRRKKGQENLQISSLQVNVDLAMPTADVLAAERASEAACERELAAVMLSESNDSGSSDGEAEIRCALRPLRLLRPPARFRPPPAAALLSVLAAELRERYPHDVHFLDEYKFLLEKSTAVEVQAVTEELMRSVERTLSAGGEGVGGAGSVVLASWLSAAAAWETPHVPGVLPALHCLLERFTPRQVSELTRALHAALEPRDLIVVSDVVRGAGGRAVLAALLLHAALGKLLGLEPKWEVGPLGAAELRKELVDRWSSLKATAQLMALVVTGRLIAGGAREEAPLLTALTPSMPKDRQDPDYLKVRVAAKTLQNLFKDS